MRRILNCSAAVAACFLTIASARAQSPAIRTIDIGMLSTTHVIFTSDLTYVDLSTPEVIAAKVVDASKNMLAIKARKEFPFTTTISALEANGTMHTFYVRFNSSPSELVIDTRTQDRSVVAQVNTQIRPDQSSSPSVQAVQQQPQAAPEQSAKKEAQGKGWRSRREGSHGHASAPSSGVTVTTEQSSNFGRSNAPTLEEVMRKPQGIFHAMDEVYHVRASIVNIFSYSDVMYVIISLENNSDIGFESGDAQFMIENKKVSAKTLSTDKDIWPKSSYGTLSCAPHSKTMIGYTIPKMTIQKNEILKVYVYEKNGTRNLFLSLDDKDVNYAVSPVQ